MKTMLKLFLVMSLFSSVIFAEGDMPGGGKTCTQNCYTSNEQPEPVTDDTNLTNPDRSTSDDSVLIFIQEYLISLIEEAGSLVNY